MCTGRNARITSARTICGRHPGSRNVATRRLSLIAALSCALVLWLSPVEQTRLLAAVSVTTVTPNGASAGVTLQITGTGFDPTAANNSVTLTPSTGAAVTLVAEAITTL